MLSQPLIGASYLFRGLTLLTAPGVKRYVAVPLAVNIGVFAFLVWNAIDLFGALVERYAPQLPEWLAWLSWLAWIVFGMAAVVLVFFTFTIVANLIAAPFNGMLAEAVERHLLGRGQQEGGWLSALASAPAQITDEFRKLAYYLKWAVPLLILFLIPGVNLVAPLLWAGFGAWMSAVQYADYPLGNHGLRSTEQRRALGHTRLLALGFGGATMTATLVPVINFLVMPAAVAGATAMVVEKIRPRESIE